MWTFLSPGRVSGLRMSLDFNHIRTKFCIMVAKCWLRTVSMSRKVHGRGDGGLTEHHSWVSCFSLQGSAFPCLFHTACSVVWVNVLSRRKSLPSTHPSLRGPCKWHSRLASILRCTSPGAGESRDCARWVKRPEFALHLPGRQRRPSAPSGSTAEVKRALEVTRTALYMTQCNGYSVSRVVSQSF